MQFVLFILKETFSANGIALVEMTNQNSAGFGE